MDSRLSQSILTHLDCIIPACVSGFSSSLWAVRNGALQLFGVLLPRMCGQKKVRDEDSEHNLVSASELFSRCPALKAYLLQQLKLCVSLHKKKRLCSELMPILSLIVKLSPQQDEMKSTVIDFKPLLIDLFDIPVWKVRDLVSSALSQFMD
ncbi:Thyroid adenoma-associated protein-like protein, partial [Stegodyphus mimosarum]